MTKDAIPNFAAPILVQGSPPLNTSDLAAARKTRSSLSTALKVIENQIAALAAHQFFVERPNIASVELGGDWESNDEGGSYFSWSGIVRNAAGELLGEDGEVTDDEDDARDYGYELCSDLCENLDDVEHEFEGETLTPANAMERVGKALMGEEAYAAWRAQAERAAIDASTSAASAEGEGALRV